MLLRDGTRRKGARERERGGTQVVSKQLHRVLLYLSCTSGDDGRIPVSVSQVLAWTFPQMLCWDILNILYNDRDGLGETGWTGCGKGLY